LGVIAFLLVGLDSRLDLAFAIGECLGVIEVAKALGEVVAFVL